MDFKHLQDAFYHPPKDDLYDLKSTYTHYDRKDREWTICVSYNLFDGEVHSLILNYALCKIGKIQVEINDPKKLEKFIPNWESLDFESDS